MCQVTFVHTVTGVKHIYQIDVDQSRFLKESIKEINLGTHEKCINEYIPYAINPSSISFYTDLSEETLCDIIETLSYHFSYRPSDYAIVLNLLNLFNDYRFYNITMWKYRFVKHAILAFYSNCSNAKELVKRLNNRTLQCIQTITLNEYSKSLNFHKFWLFYLYQTDEYKLWKLPLMDRLDVLPQIQGCLEVKESHVNQKINLPDFLLSGEMNINDETVYALISGESIMNQSEYKFIDYLIIGSKKSAIYYLSQNGITEENKINGFYSTIWPTCDTFVKDGKNRFIVTNETEINKVVSRYHPWFQFFVDKSKTLMWTKGFAFCRILGILTDSGSIVEHDILYKLGFNLLICPKKPTLSESIYLSFTKIFCCDRSLWFRLTDEE